MSQKIPTEYAIGLLDYAESITIAIDCDPNWKPSKKSSTTDLIQASTIDRDSPLFLARVKAFKNQLQASANAQAKRADFPALYFSKQVRLWPFIVNLREEV